MRAKATQADICSHLLRQWREKQQEDIAKRDEESKARRQATISAAEASIDEFYEQYNDKKTKTIAANKFVASRKCMIASGADTLPAEIKSRNTCNP